MVRGRWKSKSMIRVVPSISERPRSLARLAEVLAPMPGSEPISANSGVRISGRMF